MPIPGGASDKLGNRYEALWVVECLLKIVDGKSLQITVEPIHPDESKGIEYHILKEDGTTEFWSIKRQTSRSEGWSLANLAQKDGRGRSILDDLRVHVERNPHHFGVFASQQGTREIDELRAYAASTEQLLARLDRTPSLQDGFRRFILPLVDGNIDRARHLLEHIRFHAVDEQFLQDGVDQQISMMFYQEMEASIDPVLVHSFLSQFILDHLSRPINRDDILQALAAHGIRLRDWAHDHNVLQRVGTLFVEYTEGLQSQRINNAFIHLAAIGNILDSHDKVVAPRILLIGNAGSGEKHNPSRKWLNDFKWLESPFSGLGSTAWIRRFKPRRSWA